MSLEEANKQANGASARCKLARVGAAAIPDLKAAMRCLAIAADADGMNMACCINTRMAGLGWQLPTSVMRFLTIVTRACCCVDEYVWNGADTGGTACSQRLQARDDKLLGNRCCVVGGVHSNSGAVSTEVEVQVQKQRSKPSWTLQSQNKGNMSWSQMIEVSKAL